MIFYRWKKLKKIEKIVKELDYNLDFLEKETEGVLEKAEESIRVTKRALKQIKITRCAF